jgi:signal-transduction protein with cAMP-binding, CBS, and nucleotidyltransferase domain
MTATEPPVPVAPLGRASARAGEREGTEMPQRHASADELPQLPPFAHLSKQELRCLERLRTNIPVPPGKVLARQGHVCLEFGIVIEGTALVTRDGHEIALLESGQHFGEIGIVRVVPNPVTIVACTAVTLEVMSAQEFRSAYTTMPAFRDHIDNQIARRIATWVGPRPSVPAAQLVRTLLPAHDVDYTLAS